MSRHVTHRSALALLAYALAFVAAPVAGTHADEQRTYLVPSQLIYPGQIISQDLIVDVVIKSYRANEAIVSDRSSLFGKIARLPLRAGHPIPLRSIAEPPLVKAGKPAVASYVAGNLTIRASVVVLQDGMLGDRIRAKNFDSGKIVTGTVQADGSILVSMP